MFENALRAIVSALASAPKTKRRRRSPNEVALIALQALFIAITVASFVAWLTPSNARRSAISGFGPQSDCISFGRGGTDCTGNSAIDERSNGRLGSDEACVSLGRGGLVCNEPLGNPGHSS